MANNRETRGHVASEKLPADFWYRVLTLFPFLFFPIVASIGILLSIVMPIVTGAFKNS